MLNQMRISGEREFDIGLLDGSIAEVDADGHPVASSHSMPLMLSGSRVNGMESSLVMPTSVLRQKRMAAPVASSTRGDLANRIMDCTIATILLAVLLPVMAVIWLSLRLFEKGPAIFAHERIGRDLAPFPCFKFRTMCIDADARLQALLDSDQAMLREWTATQKLLCDPRVTKLGRFLRNTSLDELPQLFNVLRGEMSLVGPRPIVANEVRRYGRHAFDYARVRPGLTGLWQVTRNSGTSYRRRVASDVYYVRNKGLRFDCRIMLATVPAVLSGNG